MSRIVKNVFVILTVALLVLGLCSCKKKQNDNSSNIDNNVDNDVIYSPYIETSLVLGEGVNQDNLRLLKNTYLKHTGKELKIVSSDSEQKTHEIIVGKTSREISQKAYRFLTVMEKSSEEHVGYVIYSDGKSVAIAFDEAQYGVRAAFTEAIEVFVSDYMTSSTLKCKSGVLVKSSFDSIEWQDARDEKSLEALWNLKSEQILNKVEGNDVLAEEIMKELKDLYGFYNKDQKTVKWLANLYDPVTGGFYYSNSARNNEGYSPDLESTASAIGLVKSILTDYSGSLTDYFGKEISEQFINFVNNMQAADNGYFYHPQWSRTAVDINTVRRSRDLLDALNILSDFGAIPRYDTPNGVKGESAWSGVVASSSLVLPLAKNNVMMVAASATDKDDLYIPPHLTSESNFKSYLSSLDMEISALDTAKAISAQIPQILFRDGELEKEGSTYRLSDILVNWLNSKQKSSGLWGADKEISIHSLNIIYEVASIYTKLGKILSNAGTLTQRISDYIVMESGDSVNVNDISAAWIALSAISDNMNFVQDNFMAEYILSDISSKLPQLLESTRLKFVTLVKDDGSFMTSTGVNDGMSYGMPIALSVADEGNVCATLTAIKTTWIAIFKTINIGVVPVFMTADRMQFSKTLLDMGVIVKNEIVESVSIDFEDEEIGSATESAILKLSNSTTAIIESADEKYGNVLHIQSKSSLSDDVIEINPTSAVKRATCVTTEFDMCVLPGTANGTVFQIFLDKDMYMVTVDVQDGVVMLREDTSKSTSASYRHDLGVSAAVGEWFNIRFEYYVGTRDTVRIKIFFNGECIAVTNNFYANFNATTLPSSTFARLRFIMYNGKNVNLYVDNIIAESNYKTYSPETSENLVRNADAPEGKKTVHNFDSTFDGNLPNGFVQTGGTCGVVTLDGTKQLQISSGVTELKIPLSERGTLTNSAMVEFDAIVSADSEVGAYFTLAFDEYMLKNTNLAGFRFIVAEDSEGKYLTIADCLGGKEGSQYSNVRISLGESFKFRAYLFFKEKRGCLMINNTLVGLNNNVKSGLERYYMGEVALSSSDKSATLLVDNLVCERIVSVYEAVVAPSIDRETYEFDTLDGIVSNGVSLLNGAVSFKNAGNAPYIKIPVNVRSDVSTLGVVSVDISKIDVTQNDLIVSLTDGNGNRIASFAISATESGVNLYEYTKNGRYSKLLCSTTSSNFTLGIEYEFSNNDFNLLIDGKYVASTSVTYTIDSGDYNFEQLEISSSGSSGFLVDNIVAESVGHIIFSTPSYNQTNNDDTDELVTYEYSSFANMTKLYRTSYFVTQEARLRIREGTIKGAASRVLEFTSGSSGQDILLIERWTKSLAGANAVAFETDIMLSAQTKDLRLGLCLKPMDGGTACTIYVWSKDGKIMISSSNLKTKDTYLDIKDGEWFKLRVEYTGTPYDFDYDGMKDAVIRVYINGVLIGEGIKSDNPSNVFIADVVDQVRFDVNTGYVGKIYFDNTIYEQFNMEYEIPIPADTDTLTFESGVISKSVKSKLGKNSSISVKDMTISGQVNKVLQWVSANNVSDRVDISVTQMLDEANAISFETDIMILPTSDKAQIKVEPLNAQGRQPFSLVLTAQKNGVVKLSVNGVPETVIGMSGEWIHLKVEYMNPNLDYDGDGARDILVKIYIGESSTPNIIGYTPSSNTSHYSPIKLEKFRFSTEADTEAEIYLDNTKFWQVNLTPDEGGKTPIVKDDEHLGDNKLDEEGWE